jgi:glyoxylase-like metal-dependent hydrolase (beta-lactamase superfamily II)
VGAIKTPEGVILVDSPNQPTRAVRWREEVKGLGEVRYLINTEFHIDHTFGNAFLPGTVIAHQQTKDRFWQDTVIGPCPMKDPRGYAGKIDPEGVELVANYQGREPEITFDGNLTISLGGVTVEALLAPGHVPAQLAVYVPGDRVLFTSDNVFNDVMTWYHDSVPFEWLETLDRFKQMDVEVVVPGHGVAAGPEVFDEMKGIVGDAISEVQAAIEAGVSRDESVDRISFIDRQPVSEGFRPVAANLQRLFVGRIYDQILERQS